MAIIRWDPFRDLIAIQEGMNQLFEDSLSRSRSIIEESLGVKGIWSPPVDIYETEDAMVLKAELPGVEQRDIVVDLRNNILTIKGEKRQEENIKKENYHRIERYYGTFQRSFTIPNIVQQDKVKAKYKDGVLEVSMPKTEVITPKHISIEVV